MKKFLIFLLFFFCASANAAGTGSIVLTWTPGPINWDPNQPQTWRIYRRTVDQPMSLLAEIPANAVQGPNGTTQSIVSSAIDATAVVGAKYCYQVSAWNTAGESAPTNEACGIAIEGEMIGVDIPATRTGLVSRRATDGSNLISFLVNNSDIVAINDSVAAVKATVTIVTPPGKIVLISKRATDGSTIVSTLVNKSTAVFINGQQK